jgi:ubiquitin-protein ligase
MSLKISKETVKRLINDVKDIMCNPLEDNGIYYIHDDEDMMKGYAMIVGPEDTPYYGGFYFFEFNFPINYPYSPPILKYKTNVNNIRFNPNLYVNEKVCVSILNTWSGEQWSSCQTIRTILFTLLTLLNKNPLLNEPGIDIEKDKLIISKYNDIIEFCNIYYEYCDIYLKSNKIYYPFFNLFEKNYNYQFIKNYDKIYDFVLNKTLSTNNDNNKLHKVIKIPIYSIPPIELNYNLLLEKLKSCYNFYHNTVKT